MLDVDTITKRSIPILRQYGVKRAALFGSAAYGQTKMGSDIDFLVELSGPESYMNVLALHTELEEALGCQVDVVEFDNIRPEYAPYILASQKPIQI